MAVPFRLITVYCNLLTVCFCVMSGCGGSTLCTPTLTQLHKADYSVFLCHVRVWRCDVVHPNPHSSPQRWLQCVSVSCQGVEVRRSAPQPSLSSTTLITVCFCVMSGCGGATVCTPTLTQLHNADYSVFLCHVRAWGCDVVHPNPHSAPQRWLQCASVSCQGVEVRRCAPQPSLSSTTLITVCFCVMSGCGGATLCTPTLTQLHKAEIVLHKLEKQKGFFLKSSCNQCLS